MYFLGVTVVWFNRGDVLNTWLFIIFRHHSFTKNHKYLYFFEHYIIVVNKLKYKRGKQRYLKTDKGSSREGGGLGLPLLGSCRPCILYQYYNTFLRDIRLKHTKSCFFRWFLKHSEVLSFVGQKVLIIAELH